MINSDPLCRCGHVSARHLRFDGSPRGCMAYDCECPGYVPLASDPEGTRPRDEAASEFTRLWNQWLKTDDGKAYEAGWGDFANRWHAERGKVWVYQRMIEARDQEIKRLMEERRQLRLSNS